MIASTMKMATIAVVSIVVIAGLGIVLLSQGSEAYRSMDDSGRLMVFGNANNDDYLDEEDIETLESIISGELDVEDHPFADANQDGVIDEKDIEMVRKMIDREPMEIFYLNGRGEVASVNYPVYNVVVSGSAALNAIKSIGGMNTVLGVSGGSYDPILFSEAVDLPVVSDHMVRVDLELLSNLDGVRAIITQDNVRYVDNENVFKTAGIDVVRVAATDGLDTIGAVITLGYLMQMEERANEYARFCDEIVAEILDKVGPGKIENTSRVTAVSVTAINSVGGTASAYYAATQISGAINVADWDTTIQRFNLGDEWLYPYNPDFIIHSRTLGYGDVDRQGTYDVNKVYFENMQAYENGRYVIINGDMPVVIRLAYMASLFYPDLFNEGYADAKHQEFTDRFLDNLSTDGYSVTNGTWLITMESMI